MAEVVNVTGKDGRPAPKPYEVRWSVSDAHGVRRHHRQRFAKKADALDRARAEAEATAGGRVRDHRGSRESVAVWAERWYSAAKPLARPSTARGYRSTLDAGVLAEFGAVRVRDVTTAAVQAWVNALAARGLAPATVRHRVNAARWVFAEAVRAGALDVNPVADLRLPTRRRLNLPEPEPYFLTAAQVEAVAAALDRAAPDAPWGLLVRFAAWTGLRAGEVAGLNCADVDLKARVVVVRRTRERRANEWSSGTPKSGRARRVPLVPWLAEDLRDYLASRPDGGAEPDAPLWPGGRPGGHSHGTRGSVREGSSVTGAPDWDRPWESGTFYRRRYLPAVAAAGLPTGRGGVTFHALRHTYASLCASAGIGSQQVAAWMGHANDTITRHTYTHLFADDTSAAVAALGAMANGSAGRPALRLVGGEGSPGDLAANESAVGQSTRVAEQGRSLA